MHTSLPFEQILDAARQLPASERSKLLRELESLPDAEETLVAARRLRDKYRMGPRKRDRLARLLAKGNAGTLTPAEKNAAAALVAEFEQKTLALAQALTRRARNHRPSR
jgi:hypothetical protein